MKISPRLARVASTTASAAPPGSVRSMLQRYRSLPHAERRALWSATWRLAVIRLSLSTGIRKTRGRFVGQVDCKGGPLNTKELELWQMRARALRRAGSRLRDVHCLARSLALRWWMRSEGIDADCLIGVRQRAGNIESHAWVEVHHQPVGDRAEDLREYQVLSWEAAEERDYGDSPAAGVRQNDHS